MQGEKCMLYVYLYIHTFMYRVLSYTSLRYLREPLAGLFLGILKYMGHSLTKSRLSSNIDFPDIGNAVRNRMSTVQRQQCLEVECGFKFLGKHFFYYSVALKRPVFEI